MLNMLKPLDSCLYLTLSGHTRNLATNERLGSSVMDRLLDLLVASERPDHRKLTCNCLCSFGLRGQVGLWSHSKSSKSIFSKCHIMSRAPGKATRARPTTWFGISGGATRAKFCPHSASPRERDCQRITTSRLSQEVKICLSKINFRFWTLDLSHIGTIFRRDLLCDKRLPAQISEKKRLASWASVFLAHFSTAMAECPLVLGERVCTSDHTRPCYSTWTAALHPFCNEMTSLLPFHFSQ